MFENTFIVKKQKNCNFCGEILPYPSKFTFSRKCSRCSMKNSTLLLPARFLCNMCIDHNSNDLFQCHNDQIPLDSIKQAKSLQTPEQIQSIQKAILRCLESFYKDMQDEKNQSYYFDQSLACLEKASLEQYMYSNLLTILTNRMLKLLFQIIKHRLTLDQEIHNIFNEITKYSQEQVS